MEFRFRNVNDAFRSMVKVFSGNDPRLARSTSRVGDVLYIQEPVIITYTHPREKVLFNQARDCNPFFHVYEALWMLAGRNDIAGPSYYAANYRECVQDGDSPTANGAYGYRWRHARSARRGSLEQTRYETEEDQLKPIVKHLKDKPDSRRVVLQMWNVEDDLLKVDSTKDCCCNLCALFSLRTEMSQVEPYMAHRRLDMTVYNRSNDLIWGTLGANAVHFAFLQEYLAACLGVEVGVYNQISNNQHVYVNRFEPEKWLTDQTIDRYLLASQNRKSLHTVPLVQDPITFDRECAEFVERHSKDALAGYYTEPFLRDVAQPMCISFHQHRHHDYGDALNAAEYILADDWRIASVNWLLKRKAAYERKHAENV